MARGKNFFDDVKKEIECSVCQEQFSETKDPKILKCFHTFCKSCLEGWLRQQGGGALSCPTCRQITECPNNNINSLPSNLFYKQMVDIVTAYSGQGQEDSPHCRNCDERKPLKFYCSDCNCFLCEECAELHKKWKDFRGHHVKEIRNFESSDAHGYARRSNVCEQHKDEFRFFCEPCKICICRDCAILNHEDHKKISLEKGLKNKKSVLEAKMTEVQANRSRLRNHKESLEKRSVKVNKSFEQAAKEVHKVAERCKNLISQHEASVTEQLIKQKGTFQVSFVNEMTRLEGKLSEIDSSLEFGQQVLSRKNLPEILNVEKMLEKRLQELANPFEPMLNLTEVRYIPSDVSFFLNAPGELFATTTEPSLSVAEGRGLTKALRGEKGTFTVTTKDSKGRTTYSGIDQINVEINSLKTRTTLRTSITDLKNGHYQVMYTSDATGDFDVSITVRGEAIKGSPFRMTVAEKQTAASRFHFSGVQVPNRWNPQTRGLQGIVKKYIEHDAIAMFSKEHFRRIHTLEQRYHVVVSVEKAVARILVSGQSDHVLDVVGEIHKILHQIQEQQHERKRAEALSKDIEWLYNDGINFVPFVSHVNAMIETAYDGKKSTVTITSDDEDYKIDFNNMTMKDINGYVMNVRRVDRRKGVEVPNHWCPQPKDLQGIEKTVHLVELDPSQDVQEYQDVSSRFQRTCGNHILKIERVQNPALFGTYAIRKQKMDEAKGSNENLLFHGTPGHNCKIINHFGFNRSFHDKNATVYGNGVYFALDAAYSARSAYSPPDAYGFRYMYLTRVLVGEYTVGRQGLLTPPAKNPYYPTDTYDSVVDQMPNPGIFVVFYDWQCYPEYLITFQ